MNLLQHRAALSVGATLLIVMVPLVLVFGWLGHKASWASASFDNLEPRIARLAGTRDAAAAVRQARTEADSALLRFTYPASAMPDRIGTDLQQRVRLAAEEAGVRVSGSQIVGVRSDDDMEYIPVAFSFEATHPQLLSLLEALAAQTPAVFVDSLTLQSLRVRNNPGSSLNVQARFSGLRVVQ